MELPVSFWCDMSINLSYHVALMGAICRYNVEFRSSPFHRRMQCDWPCRATKGIRHTGINEAFITEWNIKSRDGAKLLCDILLTEVGNGECIHRRSQLGKNSADVMHYFMFRTKVLLETINK